MQILQYVILKGDRSTQAPDKGVIIRCVLTAKMQTKQVCHIVKDLSDCCVKNVQLFYMVRSLNPLNHRLQLVKFDCNHSKWRATL